jgi:ribonuclease D
MNSIDYQWIDTDEALVQLCKGLAQQPAIALDTEFIRTRTYYAHIGLLQVADANGVYLIDPLAIKQKKVFADILTNTNIIKVIHACSEDLEVFQYAFGVLPVSLFDTQVAAGFAGYGSAIGYANLVRATQDIDIPKQETRSDWLQRPLSDAQLRYAALDVEYLLPIHRLLVEKLEAEQRCQWAQDDCTAMIEKLRNARPEDNYFLRIKSAWKLKPDQLAVLKVMCRWRERQAREQDKTRSHVIKDTSLYDIALKLPMDVNQLKRIQDISYRLVDEFGPALLRLINDTLDDQADYPEVLDRPLSTEQTKLLKKLKSQVHRVAESLDLPQELLVRKKDYEALIRSKNSQTGYHQLPDTLMGWRQLVVGQALLDFLHSSHQGNT